MARTFQKTKRTGEDVQNTSKFAGVMSRREGSLDRAKKARQFSEKEPPQLRTLVMDGKMFGKPDFEAYINVHRVSDGESPGSIVEKYGLHKKYNDYLTALEMLRWINKDKSVNLKDGRQIGLRKYLGLQNMLSSAQSHQYLDNVFLSALQYYTTGKGKLWNIEPGCDVIVDVYFVGQGEKIVKLPEIVIEGTKPEPISGVLGDLDSRIDFDALADMYFLHALENAPWILNRGSSRRAGARNLVGSGHPVYDVSNRISVPIVDEASGETIMYGTKTRYGYNDYAYLNGFYLYDFKEHVYVVPYKFSRTNYMLDKTREDNKVKAIYGVTKFKKEDIENNLPMPEVVGEEVLKTENW